jgi:uncharacterized protein YajQ (UPF0234 family)
LTAPAGARLVDHRNNGNHSVFQRRSRALGVEPLENLAEVRVAEIAGKSYWTSLAVEHAEAPIVPLLGRNRRPKWACLSVGRSANRVEESQMPSFDIVVKVDLQEVDNAVNQAQKEMAQRYDFRGSKSKIEWDKKGTITLLADDDFKLKAVVDILQSKMVKRGLSLRNCEFGAVERAFEGTVRQTVKLAQGIPADKAKEINRIIKDAKLKVQSQTQDQQVRVTGKKKDDLQEAIALVRAKDIGLDVQFTNFRD